MIALEPQIIPKNVLATLHLHSILGKIKTELHAL